MTTLSFYAPELCAGAVAAHAPAAIMFQGKLFVAWANEQGLLDYSWGGAVKNTQFVLNGSPALEVYGSKLYLACQGDSNVIDIASFDGTTWFITAPNTSFATAYSPALAAFGGALYMAWTPLDAGSISYARYDGTTWTGPFDYSATSSQSPALASSPDVLYLAWRDDDLFLIALGTLSNGQLTFAPASQTTRGGAQGSPAIGWSNGILYTVGRGENLPNAKGSNGLYISATTDPVFAWTIQVVPVALTAGGSSLWVSPNGSLLLAWRDAVSQHDVYTSWISTQAPQYWMDKCYDQLSAKTLKTICLPGAHDAAMSSIWTCKKMGNTCNTQTQCYDMTGLLQMGVRYFDIRPAWEDSQLRCGHFQVKAGLAFGCFSGQTLDSILSDVATFMKAGKRELVILKFSHYLFGPSWRTSSDIAIIAGLVSKMLGPYLFKNTGSTRLADLPWSTLVGNAGAVLAVFEDAGGKIRFNPAAGLYSYGDYAPGRALDKDLMVYDVYSNTSDLATMQSNQLSKLQNSANHGGDMYLLSWTLTLSASTVFSYCIFDLAVEANDALPGAVSTTIAGLSQTLKPNIVYADFISSWGVQLCLQIMGIDPQSVLS